MEQKVKNLLSKVIVPLAIFIIGTVVVVSLAIKNSELKKEIAEQANTITYYQQIVLTYFDYEYITENMIDIVYESRAYGIFKKWEEEGLEENLKKVGDRLEYLMND